MATSIINIPKKLKVFGSKYEIIVCPMKDIPADSCVGLCDYNNRKIYIAKELDDKQKTLTFYHEVLHALFERIGATQNISAEMNEIISEATSQFIWDLDNALELKHGQ